MITRSLIRSLIEVRQAERIQFNRLNASLRKATKLLDGLQDINNEKDNKKANQALVLIADVRMKLMEMLKHQF